jgi:hypothetical protein
MFTNRRAIKQLNNEIFSKEINRKKARRILHTLFGTLKVLISFSFAQIHWSSEQNRLLGRFVRCKKMWKRFYD